MTQHSDQAETLKKLYIELKKSKEKLHKWEAARHEPIAVIGMGCRFPGGADDPEKFREILEKGIDAVSEVPPGRWNTDRYYDPDPLAPGKMYTDKGGFLTCPVDQFDAPFFGISPREARALDPQQRLLLEVTWEALEDAGLDTAPLKGSQTGVFLGMSSDDYTQAHVHSCRPELIDAYSLTGNTFSTAAGRISYTFGFEGPCITVDTACSSAFAALHYGIRSLRWAESDLAVIGGVNLLLIPEIHICFSKLQAISPEGKCKTFDAAANGYARGEGCGVVIIKRLADALGQGDRILAVIRGSALNQDGRSSGMTAPNGKAQEKVILQALADASLSPGDIDYIEAHGTGTALGDPIEVEALGQVYGKSHSVDSPLMIGSVKSNIGHLEPAAGMSGLIKVLQSLRHEVLPPNLHLQTPNPYISWSQLPISVLTRLTPWKRGNGKIRRAGISAFGFSGTNAHIVVEEAPAAEEINIPAPNGARFLLTLSAKSRQALTDLAGRYSRFLAATPSALPEISYTSQVGRTHFQYRLALDGASKKEMTKKLTAFCAGKPEDVITGEVKENQKIAFLFSGQGVQYVGMGRELFQGHPVFREAVQRCDELFRPFLARSVLELLFSGEGEELVNQTRYTQPLIFTLQYALVELWKSWGVNASAVVGHSIGEFAAAVLSGVMTLEEAVRLASARGRLMDSAPGRGAMGVIMADEAIVASLIRPYLQSVSLAAVNAEKNITVSGDAAAVRQVLAQASEDGYKIRELTVSHAFHSPLMDPILEEFAAMADPIRFSPVSPAITYISALTGKAASPHDLDASYWRRQIREPVRFYDAVQTLVADGYELFLEIGSAPILSSLGAQIAPDPRCLFIPSLRKGQQDWLTIMKALETLYTAGVPLDWAGVQPPGSQPGQKVSLPGYPFQRQRYWISPNGARGLPASLPGTPGAHPLLGQKLQTPLLPDTLLYQSFFNRQTPYFMQEHIIFDQAISPAASHVSMALAAAAELGGSTPWRLEHFEFITPLIGESTGMKTVQLAVQNTGAPQKKIQLLSRDMKGGDSRWEKHCTCFITAEEANQPSPRPLAVQDWEKQCPDSIDITWFYEHLWKVGYHLGPGFQRITGIRRGKNKGLFKLDFTRREEIPGFSGSGIYPGFIDSLFQAVVPTSDTCLDNMLNKGKIYIPISLSALTYYRPLSDEAWCLVRSEDSELIIKGYCTLVNPQGEVILEIRGLAAKQTDRETLYGEKAKNYQQMFYTLAWEEKNRDRAGELPPGNPETCLIFSDSRGAGAKLADAFAGQQPGSTAIRVLKDHKSGFRSSREDTYSLSPQRHEDFMRLFRELAPRLNAASSPVPLLYLWGMDTRAGEAFPGEELAESCGGLLSIIRALAELQLTHKVKLWIITREVQDPTGTSTPPAVFQAPFWGLGRTVALEYPELWGGLLDVDEPVINDGAARILAEVAAGPEEQVCLREEGKRYVARLQNPGHRGEEPAGTGRQIPTDGTYLITGGTGALGLLLARWLIRQGCAAVVLAARHEPDPEILSSIRELDNDSPDNTGKTAVVFKRTDISQEEEVRQLIDDIRQTLPPLRGVFHAAGLLDDATLGEQTWERFQRVFAPKVRGAWNLHRATRDIPLEIFVMFSSAAAWMGSPGQANYSAANEFLNALALERRKNQLPGLSINWGPWADQGMAAAQQNRGSRLAQQGIHSISPGNGLKILQTLLGWDDANPTLMVSDIDWARYRLHIPHKRKTGLFSHLIGQVDGDTPPTAAASAPGQSWLQELKNTPPAERSRVLLDRVRSLAGGIMGYDQAQQVEVNKPLAEQGVDSLMVVSIRNRLGEALETTLPVTLLYDHPTLEEMTRFLLEEAIPGTGAGKGEQLALVIEKDNQSTSRLLEEIDALLEG